MTITHDCSEEIKQADLKVTPARIAALQLFESHTLPLDAQHLVDHLVKEGIDRVTVFRILNAFVEKGLLRKLEFGEGKARYELLSRGDHQHFVCSVCSSITDITEDAAMYEYILQMEKKYKFTVSEHSVLFQGICQTCLQKGKRGFAKPLS